MGKARHEKPVSPTVLLNLSCTFSLNGIVAKATPAKHKSIGYGRDTGPPTWLVQTKTQQMQIVTRKLKITMVIAQATTQPLYRTG